MAGRVCSDVAWKEERPVVVSTRDGFRFGFFGLDECGGKPNS